MLFVGWKRRGILNDLLILTEKAWGNFIVSTKKYVKSAKFHFWLSETSNHKDFIAKSHDIDKIE